MRQFYKDISAVRQANEGCYFLFCAREVSLNLRRRQNNWTEPLQESCRHRGVGAVNSPCHQQNCTDVNGVAIRGFTRKTLFLCSPPMLAVLNSCLLITNQSSHNRNLGWNVQQLAKDPLFYNWVEENNPKDAFSNTWHTELNWENLAFKVTRHAGDGEHFWLHLASADTEKWP